MDENTVQHFSEKSFIMIDCVELAHAPPLTGVCQARGPCPQVSDAADVFCCCLGRLRRFGVHRWDSASTPPAPFLARVFQHGLNVVTDNHDLGTMPRSDKLAGYPVFVFR